MNSSKRQQRRRGVTMSIFGYVDETQRPACFEAHLSLLLIDVRPYPDPRVWQVTEGRQRKARPGL